jgi:heme A synthase
MRSRSSLLIVAFLVAVVLVGGAVAGDWSKPLERGWPDRRVEIFCDGPHRVYVAFGKGSAETGVALAVVPNGCIGWPKVPAEAR